MLTALFSFVSTESSFADSFTVNFDKQQYFFGDSLTVSGNIPNASVPIMAMSVYDPDGKILSANNLEISSQNTFSKTISLGSPFYEKIGDYVIKLDYGNISENHRFILESIVSDIFVENVIIPEITLLSTDKTQYTDKDTIEISGLVSVLDSPTVLMGVYDPFGIPAGFYFGTVNSNLEFSTNLLVKSGVNFRVDGTYSIKAHYADSEIISFFDFYKDLKVIIDDVSTEETITEEAITSPPTVVRIGNKEVSSKTIPNSEIKEFVLIDEQDSSKNILSDVELKNKLILLLRILN